MTVSTNGAMAAPTRGNLKAHTSEETGSAFKNALEHLDRIKTNLKQAVSDLGEVSSLLKAAEKEQKVSAKEIESFRAKLREIQSVAI